MLEMISILSASAADLFHDDKENFKLMLGAISPLLASLGLAGSVMSLSLETESPGYQQIKRLLRMVDVGFP